MSSLPHPHADQSPASPDPAEELARLRAELDRLDDALHDTLRSRAAVVARIGASAAKGTLKLRMGRQAGILRRLLARHDGGYPPASVVRVWLELLSGTIAMQAPFSVAVGQAEGDAALSATAREQFGALCRLRAWGSVGQAIGEVRAGTASVAVLPLPHEGEAMSAAWWTGLLNRNGPGTVPRLHVVARLPLWSPRPEGAPAAQALVVAGVPPDPSGADRTLLGLELAPEGSRTRLLAALAAAGLAPGRVLLRRDPGSPTSRALAEVEGFLADDDPRLSAAPLQALGDSRHGPVVLGAYAIPLGDPGAAPLRNAAP
ncbi:MAG: chorismate mutase [Janthinobacterium lividum]